MVIHVVTPDNYWPLPWYLRRFRREHVGYWQDADTWWRDTRDHPPPSVVILSPEVQDVVDARLRASYNKQRIVSLRPEVFLAVYVRQDLWDAFLLRAQQPNPKLQTPNPKQIPSSKFQTS
jgi:predicted membrane-bound mannosyltransferase